MKHVHFVGIKGVGMTPLAIIAKEAGLQVTGSDVSEQFITDLALQQVNIIPFVGFKPEHVTGANLVITTGAHGGLDNPEVISAREKNIRVITQGEAVGLFMEGSILGRKFIGISVAGTHGKTTTTAMIATIFKASKLDPSYLIGTSHIASLDRSGHYGKGTYFIAEADEYATDPLHDTRAKFLWQHPQIAVFTNLELDHVDIYPDIVALQTVFSAFMNQLPLNGILIVNGDDHQIQKILRNYTGRKITFGFNENNDFILRRVHISADHTFFHVTAYGTDFGEFMLAVPGEHNCLNAIGATIVSLEIGLPLEVVKSALKKFTGSKRRLEFKGPLDSGALLYDDYAHHPTEISETLAAVRAIYPKKKIICIFQPHTYSRTKALFDDFSRAFNSADKVIIMDIYASMREKPDNSISAQLLVEKMKLLRKDVILLPEIQNVVEYLNENKFDSDTVVVTMGAGDVYKISEKLRLKSYKL